MEHQETQTTSAQQPAEQAIKPPLNSRTMEAANVKDNETDLTTYRIHSDWVRKYGGLMEEPLKIVDTSHPDFAALPQLLRDIAMAAATTAVDQAVAAMKDEARAAEDKMVVVELIKRRAATRFAAVRESALMPIAQRATANLTTLKKITETVPDNNAFKGFGSIDSFRYLSSEMKLNAAARQLTYHIRAVAQKNHIQQFIPLSGYNFSIVIKLIKGRAKSTNWIILCNFTDFETKFNKFIKDFAATIRRSLQLKNCRLSLRTITTVNDLATNDFAHCP